MQAGGENPSNPSGNPISIVDPLPPTANTDQLKSLTGPKLRKSNAAPPGGGNWNQHHSSVTPGGILIQHKNGQNQNLISKKNNGSVTSRDTSRDKEIQTSTFSLLQLASAAAQTQTSLSSAGNNNSDLTPKFESSFDKTIQKS